MSKEILFPVARMIGGSVYTPFAETDNFNKPKLDTEGKPVTSFSFGIAIPKGAEQHWAQTPWGQQVYAIGQAAHPQFHNLPTYAWKIKDGDSKVPNRVGKLLSLQEGCAGCWVIWFKQKWAPKLVAEKGSIQLIEPEAVIPGYYVEVFASVAPNTGPTPGVYLNPLAVNRVAFGEKIITASVDTTSVGFGQSTQLPAGASLTPVGGGYVPSSNKTSVVGGGYVPPNPNPAILVIPPVPGAAAPPPLPPTSPTMTAKAGGKVREEFIALGWTDALLIEHGYMTL